MPTYRRRDRIVFLNDIDKDAFGRPSTVSAVAGDAGVIITWSKGGWLKVRVDRTGQIVTVRAGAGVQREDPADSLRRGAPTCCENQHTNKNTKTEWDAYHTTKQMETMAAQLIGASANISKALKVADSSPDKASSVLIAEAGLSGQLVRDLVHTARMVLMFKLTAQGKNIDAANMPKWMSNDLTVADFVSRGPRAD